MTKFYLEIIASLFPKLRCLVLRLFCGNFKYKFFNEHTVNNFRVEVKFPDMSFDVCDYGKFNIFVNFYHKRFGRLTYVCEHL